MENPPPKQKTNASQHIPALASGLVLRYTNTISMRQYITKRLLLMPLTLIGVSFLVFCLTRMVPGGPVEQMLQEQAIGALSGDKGSGSPGGVQVDEEALEKLEELFSLNEPISTAYLQWLGLRHRQVGKCRAYFNETGSAYITLTSREGKSSIIEITREGLRATYLAPDWIAKENWKIKIESPEMRAQQARKRMGSRASRNAEDYTYRAVAYRREYLGLLQGSLGRSYKYNEPVWDMMWERIPVSLYFGLLGALITYVISIPLGVLKALHHKSWLDNLSSVFIFVGYAVPGFALGAVLLVYLGARLEWFPLYGLVSPNFDEMSWQEQARDIAAHTVLPLLCYVISTFAITTMMMKNNLMEQLSADYIRTAVAKGVPFKRAVWRHAFRNSVIPIVSTLGSVLCVIVSGSILIERVFDIQGFGMLSFQALLDKDYSLIMGTLLLSAVLIVFGNLLADIIVASIDRRVRFDGDSKH